MDFLEYYVLTVAEAVKKTKCIFFLIYPAELFGYKKIIIIAGGDKLRYSARFEVQSGDSHFPPMERRQTRLWAQLLVPGGRRLLRPRHDAHAGGTLDHTCQNMETRRPLHCNCERLVSRRLYQQ